MSDKVKLLIQKHKDSNGKIQNAEPHVVGAVIKRDGLRALDSAEFIIPSETPVSEGQVVKWIQDDADTTYLRSCYLLQGSKRDEGGWEADGTPDTYSSGTGEVSKFRHGTSGKFKGLLHMEGADNQNYITIPNKKMLTNNSAGGTREENVHNFDGDFDIFIWISAGNTPSGTLFFKGVGANDQRVKIRASRSGSTTYASVELEDSDGTTEFLNTNGIKYLKHNAVNLVRFRRIGSKFSLWVINGSEDASTLFDTPDKESTDVNIGALTANSNTVIGSTGTSDIYSDISEGEWIQSVRIYCGGTLDLLDARALFKARAQPLVMKFAGTIWKIRDTTNGKKIYANGFGKVLTKTTLDTAILNSDTDDQHTPTNGDDGNNVLDRDLNVYTGQSMYNIVYSLLTMLNNANSSMTSNAKDFSNFEVHLAKSVSGNHIDSFVAEGNLLQVIKMLVIHGIGSNLHFYISPRGICLIEDLGVDRGVTFEHNPYNMQENGADDTFTVNDLTVIGRIPIKTVVIEKSGQALDTDIDLNNGNKLGKSIPVAVRVYNESDSEWLENSGVVGDFTIDRENKTININNWNTGQGSGTKNIKIHVDFEDIQLSGTGKNYIQDEDTTSVNTIGRYKKTIYVPQFNNSPTSLQVFFNNMLTLSKNINKRYKVKAPFLVNFVRENHKVTIKNTIKGINASNQIIKSIHWHYPKNETIIEVGEHSDSAYDLVVNSNEAIHALKSQTLKSMNREI